MTVHFVFVSFIYLLQQWLANKIAIGSTIFNNGRTKERKKTMEYFGNRFQFYATVATMLAAYSVIDSIETTTKVNTLAIFFITHTRSQGEACILTNEKRKKKKSDIIEKKDSSYTISAYYQDRDCALVSSLVENYEKCIFNELSYYALERYGKTIVPLHILYTSILGIRSPLTSTVSHNVTDLFSCMSVIQ